MKHAKLIALLLILVAITAIGIFVYPKPFEKKPPPSTSRTEEQQNVKRLGSREDFVKPTDVELREMLTDLQYYVTQQDGTEEAENNEYWDNYEDGIYVDIVSGEPLFSSEDKFKSYRLAELHPTTRSRRDRREDRPQAVPRHAYRDSLQNC